MGIEKKANSRIGRPADEAKREAIMEAASRMFFDVGFAATAIEQVAQKADVSKVTVYNHFTDKRGLFKATVARECEKMRDSFSLKPNEATDLRSRLFEIGFSMTSFLARPEMTRFELRIAAETEHEPEIGRSFLEAGPNRMRTAFVAWLSNEVENSRLDIEDLPLAAEQFLSMCKGFSDLERRFGAFADPERNHERIEGAVDVFLKVYGRSE